MFHFYRNFIQHLDGNWGNLADSLRSLHVSENEISEITFNHDEKKHNFSTSALSSLPSLIQMHHPLPEPQQQQQIPPIKPQSFKTFAKLRKLVWLDLSSNRISHVGNTLPKSLVTVDLSRNVISQFPTSMVEHLHDLRILNLRDNIITKLADISFQLNKMHLEKIDLSSNIIDELPENLFNRTVHIKAINFDKNFITFVPSNAFFNMNLVHLVLSFNYIDEIYEGAFNGLENSLEYLDLERNFLSKIPSAIYNMNKLRYLYFTSNDISSINPALPSTLKVLSLSSNNFTQIPVEGLINCTDLSYLNMGYNRISGFEQGTFVEWGTQLQTLLLRNNKIARLNYGVFNGLDSIKEISLSFNELFFVHPNVFENISKSLKILELSFSIYSEDYPHEAIAQLTELMWLGLDNNNLKLIPPDSLSTLLELTYINLSFNRLTLIPGNLFLADVHKNLLEIDLSYNSLTTISSNSFASLELLQLINLSSNKIKCLEKSSFYNLPYLTYIDLSYGLLANISESAFEILPNMLSLDIMHNQLYTFSLKVGIFTLYILL